VILLAVNGSSITVTVGGVTLSFTFAARVDKLGVSHGINDGIVGIGSFATSATIDDVVVQAPPGAITIDYSVDFSNSTVSPNKPASVLFGLNGVTPSTGTWTTTTDGRFVGTAATTAAPAFNFIGYPVTAGSMVELTMTYKTSGQGGVVFDYYGPNAYKFATI